ncbi:MAG: dodecin [Balneolales bacterium]
MSNKVYKSIELTGSSDTSSDDAVKNAIARASKTVHEIKWFEVIEQRGRIEKGIVESWQVIIKVGFALED